MTDGFVSNRRQLFGATGKSFLAGLLARLPVLAAPKAEANIYQRIGVQPVINCKGTYTILSGSQSLPEVKKALEEASRHYVHLDEMMDAIACDTNIFTASTSEVRFVSSLAGVTC